MAIVPPASEVADEDRKSRNPLIDNQNVDERYGSGFSQLPDDTIINHHWIRQAVIAPYFTLRTEGSSCPQEHCYQCNASSCTNCNPGWFGSDCSDRCTGCWEDTCDQYSGTCTKCAPGFYTMSCHTPCPKNCQASGDGNKYCERKAGRCKQGCRSSYWGDKCSEECSPRCEDLSCSQANGHCLHGCKTGWYGVMCGTLCPENCLSSCSLIQGDCEACDYGYQGPKCNISCDHCKDEDCTYNDVSMKITCTRGCKDGWTSTDCMARCNKGCKGGVCDMTGKCSCKDGYYGDSCSEPCPEGCNHNVCFKSGRCRYCADGFYGDKCKKHCPKACQKCDKTSGHCSGHNSGSRADSWMSELGLIPMLAFDVFIMRVWRMFEIE